MDDKLLGLNNFWEKTTSQKIKRSDYILIMIKDMIDSNQYLKRFIRYSSENPLAKTCVNKDGKEIIQPNLLKPISENNSEGKKNLFLYGFNQDINIKDQNYIFLENYKIVYDNYNNIANMFINITILTQVPYLDLKDSDSDFKIHRNKIIAHTIDNMLDGYTIDNDFSKIIGNLKFELDDYSEIRLSKENDFILTVMTYKTQYRTDRKR